MGWSHGGYITLFTVFREQTPFKAAAAMVPVTNLVFRLSYKGPRYQRQFATQSRIGGLPFEKPELYIQRSPLYHVDKLNTPLLVHVATNDTDVDFVEDQQIIDALRSRKPHLTETKIYVDPPPGPVSVGHTFNRRTNLETLERDDSPEQRDSWNRTWAFFEWNLRAYEGQGRRDKGEGRKDNPLITENWELETDERQNRTKTDACGPTASMSGLRSRPASPLFDK
jgi:dienelactone hydrolase